jgi:uncharacterized glyoxalase superfamily protein PhnB
VSRLGRAAPTLGVRDLARALAFWEPVFGFARTFENGDPVSFVILKRDAAEVHLQAIPEYAGPAHNVMHLMVDDGVDELYRRCEAAPGAQIVSKLRDAPWGLRTFVVADPDGNRIDVGQRI